MVRVFSLVRDVVKEVSLDDIKSNFPVWVRCISPDKAALSKLSELSKIPVDDLSDFLEGDERPLLYKGKYLEVIYSAPAISSDGELDTTPVYIYHNNNVVITIEVVRSRVLDLFEQKCSRNKGKYLFKRVPAYFIFNVLDKINDEFLLNVDRISSTLDIFEKKLSMLNERSMERIYQSSVVLSSFNQSILANIEVLNSLKKVYYRGFTSVDRENFSGLYYDALQIMDHEKVQRDVIANLFNLQSSLTSFRLNEFMKKLTSIAFIIMVPTLVASIYGMNFDYIPLAHHPYGFHITVVAMFSLLMLVYLVFKKLDFV